MAKIHKLTKGGQTIYPATTTDAVVHPTTRKNLTEELSGLKINVNELTNSYISTVTISKNDFYAKFDNKGCNGRMELINKEGYCVYVYAIPANTVSATFKVAKSVLTTSSGGIGYVLLRNRTDFSFTMTNKNEDGETVTCLFGKEYAFLIITYLLNDDDFPFEGVSFSLSNNKHNITGMEMLDKKNVIMDGNDLVTDIQKTYSCLIDITDDHNNLYINSIKRSVSASYYDKFYNADMVKVGETKFFIDNPKSDVPQDIIPTGARYISFNTSLGVYMYKKINSTFADINKLTDKIEDLAKYTTDINIEKIISYGFNDTNSAIGYLLAEISRLNAEKPLEPYSLNDITLDLVNKVREQYTKINPNNKYCSIAIISDLHTLPKDLNSGSEYIGMEGYENAKLMCYLINDLGCDAGFCLGDMSEMRLVSDPDRFNISKDKGEKIYADIVNKYRNIFLNFTKAPVFLCIGNHEQTAGYSREKLMNLLYNFNRPSANVDIKYNEEFGINGSYRVDFKKHKIRISVFSDALTNTYERPHVSVNYNLLKQDYDCENPEEWIMGLISHILDKSSDNARAQNVSKNLVDGTSQIGSYIQERKIKGSFGSIGGHFHTDNLVHDVNDIYTLKINKSFYKSKEKLLTDDYCVTIIVFDTDNMKVHALRVGNEKWQDWDGKEINVPAPTFPLSYDIYVG